MNTFKNYTAIHLRLNQISLLEVVIFLMTYLKEYMFQLKLKISCEYNCRFDKKNVTHISGGITINIDMSIKNVM